VKHWDEIEALLRDPPPEDAKLKPWQQTFVRLTREEAAARKERDAIVAKHQSQ
jgi:hypothetical protein